MLRPYAPATFPKTYLENFWWKKFGPILVTWPYYDVIGHIDVKIFEICKNCFWVYVSYTVGKRTIRAFQRAQNQLHISIRYIDFSNWPIRTLHYKNCWRQRLGHDMNNFFGIFRSRTVRILYMYFFPHVLSKLVML